MINEYTTNIVGYDSRVSRDAARVYDPPELRVMNPFVGVLCGP